MTYFLRTMLVTLGIAGCSTIAAADPGIHLNALGDNAMVPNALGDNALGDNAVASTGVAKTNGNAARGLFVIGIELPNR